MKIKIFLCILMLLYLHICLYANEPVNDNYELVVLEDGSIAMEGNIRENERATTDYEDDTLQKAFTFYTEGNLAFINGNYQKAIDFYTASINLNPTVNSYYNRALAYSRMGNSQSDENKKILYEKSIVDYSNAININDLDAHLYNNRGVVYVRLGLFAEAMIDFYKAKELAPNDLDIENNLNKINQMNIE